VAGATLLSFGNGAPDVFAQINAMSHSSVQGISLGVGAALGAAFFVAAAVFPIVVLVSPPPLGEGEGEEEDDWEDALEEDEDDDGFYDGYDGHGGDALLARRRRRLASMADSDAMMYPRHDAPAPPGWWDGILESVAKGGVVVERVPFARDSVFYAVAVASIIGTLLTGTVTLTEASALSAIYVVYVLAVLVPSRVAALLARKHAAVADATDADALAAAPSFDDDADAEEEPTVPTWRQPRGGRIGGSDGGGGRAGSRSSGDIAGGGAVGAVDHRVNVRGGGGGGSSVASGGSGGSGRPGYLGYLGWLHSVGLCTLNQVDP
jgi:sodium/potassium/calcium exchanger 6